MSARLFCSLWCSMVYAGIGKPGRVGPGQYLQSTVPYWVPLFKSLCRYWHGIHAGRHAISPLSLSKCQLCNPLPYIVPKEYLSPGCPHDFWGSGLRRSISVLSGECWSPTCVGLDSPVSPIGPGWEVIASFIGYASRIHP